MKIFVAGVTPVQSMSFSLSPASPKHQDKWLVMAALRGKQLDITISGDEGVRHLQLTGIDTSNLGSLRSIRAEAIAQKARSTCHGPLLDFEHFYEQAATNIRNLSQSGLVSSDAIEDLQDHLNHSHEILSPTTFASHVKEQGHDDILDNLYRYLTHPGEITFWAEYWALISSKLSHWIHTTG